MQAELTPKMGDIVERLRDQRWTHPPHSLLLEAAQEIKRLRGTGETMSNFDTELRMLIEKCWYERGESLESMVEAMRAHTEHLEAVLKAQPEMRTKE